MKDVGTLKELGVQAGDMVEYTAIGESHFKAKTFTFAGWKGRIPYSEDQEFGGETNLRTDSKAIFRILTRATPEPKLWHDMTAEEKGALLLAAHDGDEVQWCPDGYWTKAYAFMDPYTYRIRPEPKVETVTRDIWMDRLGWLYEDITCHHPVRVTFKTVDGVIDVSTYKVEPR